MSTPAELVLQPPTAAPDRNPWAGYGNLPLQAVVSLPLQRIALADLARIAPGTTFRSAHHVTTDLFLAVQNVFMASVSLEPAGGTRGARINNFEPRTGNIEPRTGSFESRTEHLPLEPTSTPIAAAADPFPLEAQPLRDCTVPLSLCFGTRTLPLQDAMLLAPGQLLALDVPLLDPVSLLVNNRVIAYGTPMLQSSFYSVLVTHLAGSRAN